MLKTILWGGEILEDWKIKISVLWLLNLVTSLGYMIFSIFEPGALQQFLSTGEIGGMKMGPEILLIGAIEIVLVPFVMAFLTLILKDLMNRWSNIILGIVYTVLGVLTFGEALGKLSAYGTLMTFLILITAPLIVWYAWKSKQKA